MIVNEALTTIISTILDRQLGKAIAHLENYFYTFIQPQAAEQLAEIKADYQLMGDYWLKGYNDPQREQLYDQLLRRMYVLTTNVYIRYAIRYSSYVSSVYNRCRSGRQEWSAASLRRDMEAFVSDVAMLELEPEHVRRQKQRETFEQHQRMMSDLFDYIWTTRLWTDSVTDAFEDMLLSPTIDSNDQQLMVSAITLSLLNHFGFNKFRLLLNVYRKSQDERVRQRALVGWVLGLDADAARLYTEMHELVEETLADERCLNELTELQMQMVFCLRAEQDTQIIQSEIMPELMKSGNIRITRNGIEEVDDDPMDDVLHPELSEERMERLEESMRRMVDMQRQGADIYFGGFSQMKRFPFFGDVSNWFLPFMFEHPVVADVLSNARGSKFLAAMMKNGSFCDSDKYSFVLGYQMTLRHLPEHLLELMDRGEATVVGGELTDEEIQSPAYIRRSYLQNLYRFFKVYPQRSEFVNPFETTERPRYLFFANPIVQQTALEQKFNALVYFLFHQKAYDAARKVLQNYRSECRDKQFYLLNGLILQRTHAERNVGLTAEESFRRVIELAPDEERAWSGYARSLFAAHDYEQALTYYRQLVERHPDSQSYQLSEAICLMMMKDYDGALKILFKLNYETPDNAKVNRVLAWTLVGAHKYEQAGRLYDELLSVEQPAADDIQNAAYYRWFSGDVIGALELFRRYGKCEGVAFDATREFFVDEAGLLREHGISEVDARLMAGMLL